MRSQIKNYTMKTEPIEFIILVAGNFIPMVIAREQMKEVDESIQKLIEANPDKWLCLCDKDGFIRRFHPKAVVGWYFRELAAPSPVQIQALEVMKKMEQKLPKPDEGEDWKGGQA